MMTIVGSTTIENFDAEPERGPKEHDDEQMAAKIHTSGSLDVRQSFALCFGRAAYTFEQLSTTREPCWSPDSSCVTERFNRP